MQSRIMLAAAMLAAAAPATAQEHVHPAHGAGHEHSAPSGQMPLLPGLGSWSLKVTTVSRLTQQYFDQGLNLSYGFNHDEATRSFREAFVRDPGCAMCAWGIAYSLSPNINMPMSAEAEEQAVAAVRAAQALRFDVAPLERDLIEALAQRFGLPAGEDRAARDSAYALAMKQLVGKYPGNIDVLVLYADAMMNLRPWDHWQKDGTPQPGTLEVVQVLERAMALSDRHAGACHFYVHAVEASQQPERALPCAKRLPQLMPGAGHLVHMPAHVYMRVGMYNDAVRANIAAMQADHDLFASHEVAQGIYPMFYAKHNIHFLWAAYMMSGQRAQALGAAQTLFERITPEELHAAEALQGLYVSKLLTYVRFGDWRDVLAEPAPAADLLFARANSHYARGVAHAALGDLVSAKQELDSLVAVTARIPDEMIIILNPARAVLKVADLALRGRIAAATGDTDDAVRLLRDAAAAEDELLYDEPPAWFEPVRQVLGHVLLDAQRAAEAEAVFREDLRTFRENGWSLAGLERALRAQGRTAEAADVARRLAAAWKHADVKPGIRLQRIGFGTEHLPTGVKMRYASAGPLGGETIVFLHGYSDSWYSWSQVLARLPQNVRAIAVDLRGHGRTEYAGDDYSIRSLADDVAALLSRLGIIRATIAGHSLGASVAQAMSVHHPERVQALVLVAPALKGDLPLVHELRAAVLEQPDPMPLEFIREFQLGTIHAPVPDAFIQRVIVESGRLSSAAWRGLITGLAAFDYSERLAAVNAPTLIVAGIDDVVFPVEQQQALHARLRNARLVLYEDTGHALHWERPDRFADDLIGFIAPSLAGR